MTQTEFAELLGVTFGTVNRWGNGMYEPTTKIKRKLQQYFEKYQIEIEDQMSYLLRPKEEKNIA